MATGILVLATAVMLGSVLSGIVYDIMEGK